MKIGDLSLGILAIGMTFKAGLDVPISFHHLFISILLLVVSFSLILWIWLRIWPCEPSGWLQIVFPVLMFNGPLLAGVLVTLCGAHP